MPRTQAPCNGQIITDIVIRTQAPSYGGLFARSPVLGRLVTSMHVATDPSVIRHFLLMRQGERCTIQLRRETERILRAQPFLADATVTAYADGQDAVRLEVVTVDEPSVLASLGLKSGAPYLRALTFGNANVRGKGILAQAGWREGGFYRDTYLAAYTNYQLFRRPYQLQLRAAQREHGYDLSTTVSHPFFSDVQRRAWRVAGGASEDLIPFRSPGRPRISLGIRRQFFDAGGGIRLGTVGHLGLLGASLSTERAAPAARPVLVTDSGLVTDTTGALLNRYSLYRTTRFNLLAGYRNVNFLRVTGFEALNGAQDMRRGIQVGTTFGRGLPVGGARRGEFFAATDVYAGVGSAHSFVALEAAGEARRNQTSAQWDGVLMSGRLGWYLKPHRRHTVSGSVEFAAGRRQLQPFQLSLGDARGGVRGYGDAELGGGQRLAMRLEERWRVGNIRGTADAGVALFTDVGRLWAGDAPLGQDTPFEPAIGVGLLGAIPPGSQRMWRLDLAIPLRNDAGARWEVRFSSADRTRAFWTEPNDVRSNRERTVPARVFTWP